MSRSRRRTPVTGMTTAVSDKAYKTAAHRRARRAARARDLTRDELPEAKAFSDPWLSEKDGKQRFDADRWPELLRK